MSDQEQEQLQPPQHQSQPGIEEMTPEPDPGPRADPIPDVLPGQDPKVDQEWEKAKEEPMGGESPSS